MKRVDRLIKKAKSMIIKTITGLFPPNDDGFMDALGVDPEKYKRTASDGTVGYDFLAALNDIAAECWEGWENDEER